MFFFVVGVFIEITISTSVINEIRNISWIICNINLMPSFSSTYFNKLIGIMGNLNGVNNDDVFGRNGQKVGNIASEREVYQVASTCLY
jgi:hypothetical protein